MAAVAALAVATAGLGLVAAGPSPSAAAAGAPTVATPSSSLAVGDRHACAVTSAGGVRCWGSNAHHQVGAASDTHIDSPTDIPGLTGVVAVAVGTDHSCALEGDGTVVCWGSRANGRIGDGGATTGDQDTPAVASDAGDRKAVAIAADAGHSCLLTDAGEVWCWGEGTWGALAGSTTDASSPRQVSGLGSAATQIGTSDFHSCALLDDRSVQCWGTNTQKQVAPGASEATKLAPITVNGLPADVASLSVGDYTSCAGTEVGSLWCWGMVNGSIVTKVTRQKDVPAALSQFDVGSVGGCGVDAAGAAICGGNANNGSNGSADRSDLTSPAVVGPLSHDVTAVVKATSRACALLRDGSLRCWGAEGDGALGNGDDPGTSSPTTAAGFGSDVAAMGAGRQHACALRQDGTVRCVGEGSIGRLGDGRTANVDTTTPVTVDGLSGASSLSVGGNHACSVTTSSTLWCWGFGQWGRLGLGDGSNSYAAAEVTALGTTVESVSAGADHTCTVSTAGAASCFGSDQYGEVGNGTTATQVFAPTAVTGLGSGVASVSAGGDSACAVLDAGTVRCWGRNQAGQLGNGGHTNSSTPVSVSGISSGATKVSVGVDHACAVVSGGVRCWGSNALGQAGGSTVADQVVPAAVAGLTSGVVDVVALAQASCALTDTGAVACWGSNDRGRLGTGDVAVSSSTPTTVVASGATSIGSGPNAPTVCATTASHAATCWGDDADGQQAADPGWTPVSVLGGSAFTAGPAASAPFASWGAMVDSLYTKVIARPPTASERSTAVAGLAAGALHPGSIVAGLRASTDNVSNVDPVTRLYAAYFLRIPDAGGLKYWIAKKRAGRQLRKISDSFASSSEFTRRYGSLSNRAFVELIYQNLFGRAGDPTGISYWTGKLDRKAETRGGVMASFSESSEYRTKQGSETEVAVLHVLLLGRAPTAAEFSSAVARLDSGELTPATLAAVLARRS